MSTYVYGGRDFKGNIVSNASMPSVAGAPGAWPAPVLDTNSGHAQWSTVNKKPYWWDTNTNTWISYSDAGSAFYGVRTELLGDPVEVDCGLPTVKAIHTGYSTISVPVLTALQLAAYPVISTAHPLVVDLSIYTGFTLTDGNVGAEAEVYNRRGALIIRSTMDTAPSGVTTHPGFQGIWYHGWEQGLATNTIDGKLGPSWTTVAKTVETPTLYTRADTVGAYAIDAVDTHTMLAIAYPGESCKVATYAAATHTDILTWQLNYDNVNGLMFSATSTFASNFWIAFAYTNDWLDCGDPFPGFYGIPKGYYTTYWF